MTGLTCALDHAGSRNPASGVIAKDIAPVKGMAPVRFFKAGTCGAEHSLVQVQLTEFASESFPLVIGGRAASGIPRTADSAPIQGLLDFGDLEFGAHPLSEPGLRTLSRGAAPRRGHPEALADPRAASSCLSIIGMIKPGRTVRLYRQIR